VATLIVSIMLVASLQTVGASRVSQLKNAYLSQGQDLAHLLLAEILNLAFEDPDGGTGFGPETGESFPFDDVDDYAGWSGPVTDLQGTALAGYEGWTWSVAVDRVNPADISQVLTTNTGLLRVTVTVQAKGPTVATATALKAKL
jgi:hypothetical protein